MAMAVGGRTGARADINMTPLIDVLLVLLIIFMVVAPSKPKGLEALVPQPNPNQQQKPEENIRTVVITVDPGNHIAINQEAVDKRLLGDKLVEIFKTRAERLVFIKGDPNLNFIDVADVIDIAKGAGIDKIGLITEDIAAGR